MLERALRLDWRETVSLRRGLIFGDLQILARVLRLTASRKPLYKKLTSAIYKAEVFVIHENRCVRRQGEPISPVHKRYSGLFLIT